jgi:antitoxin component YwqK of YwqJK toxin-antitoxin module
MRLKFLVTIAAVILIGFLLSSCRIADKVMNQGKNVPPPFVSGGTEGNVTVSSEMAVKIYKEAEEDKKTLLGSWEGYGEAMTFREKDVLISDEIASYFSDWDLQVIQNEKILTVGNWNYHYTLENGTLDLNGQGRILTKVDHMPDFVDINSRFVYDETLVSDKNNGIYFNGDISSASVEERTTVYYLKTGTKYYEGGLLNGKKNGQGTLFFGNGYVKCVAEFKDDVFDGKYTEYYFGADKKVKVIGSYKKGALHGDYVSFYKNGNRMFEGKYKDGRPMGDFKEYYENGGLKREGTYSDPLFGSYGINGFLREYSEKGVLLYEGNVKNGIYDGKGKLYHDNEKLKYEGGFSNGVYDGKGSLYDIEGTVIYSGKWKNGEFIG